MNSIIKLKSKSVSRIYGSNLALSSSISFPFIQKRYMRTLLSNYWNKVSIRAKKKVLESQERNYALKGYRIKPEAVDVKTGKPIDNELAKKSNRVFILNTDNNEINSAITHAPAGIFETKPLEKRKNGVDQRLGTTVDTIQPLDPSVLEPAPEAQPLIDRNKEKIDSYHESFSKEVKESGVAVRVIGVVHKDNFKRFQDEKQSNYEQD